MNEFDRLKMKDKETVDEFSGKLFEISSKLAALGVSIEESKLVKFLSSLPRKKYIHIVASLEQVLDLTTTNFEDIIGRLKAYKECIAEDEENPQEYQKQLMFTNMESQANQSNKGYNDFRNIGQGGRGSWYRGRGRGR